MVFGSLIKPKLLLSKVSQPRFFRVSGFQGFRVRVEVFGGEQVALQHVLHQFPMNVGRGASALQIIPKGLS